MIFIRMIVILAAFFLLSCSSPTEIQKSGNTAVHKEKTDPYIIDSPFPPGYYFNDKLPDRTVFLTFDDGPTEWTEGILDTLKKENVKATFFICARWNYRSRPGNSFVRYRTTLIRMKNEGHVIANHTARHRVLTRMPRARIELELADNQEMLDKALGANSVVMTIFRPPLGRPWMGKSAQNEKLRVARITSRYALVSLWTFRADSTDSWNWVEGEWYRKCSRVNTETAQFKAKKKHIYNRIISNADGRGMVVLCHDTHNTTAEALPEVVKTLKARGYVFCTMEDFFLWKYGTGSRDLVEGRK